MDTKLFALMATVGLLLFAFGPVAGTVAAQSAGNDTTAGNDSLTDAGNEGLAVSVSQAGNDGAVVTVTDDGEPVEGATVNVEGTDGDIYIGEGEYTTGADGTVSLPEPNFEVTIEVTATNDSETATTTATLTTEEEDTFGMAVSEFVQSLLSKAGLDGGIGFHVASYVTQNNPGNAPDHAGPPEDKANSQGPPEDRGNDKAKTQGPPEDRGPNKSDAESEDVEDDETETQEEADDEETEDEAEEEETEEAEDDEDDEDGESGPPDHANGNGN